MYLAKKPIMKKYSNNQLFKSSIIFLFIAVVALISLWLPIFFAALPLSGS